MPKRAQGLQGSCGGAGDMVDWFLIGIEDTRKRSTRGLASQVCAMPTLPHALVTEPHAQRRLLIAVSVMRERRRINYFVFSKYKLHVRSNTEQRSCWFSLYRIPATAYLNNGPAGCVCLGRRFVFLWCCLLTMPTVCGMV